MRKSIAAAVFVALLAGAGFYAVAQEPLVRKPLQKSEFPGDQWATYTTLLTVAPNAPIPRHSHPGIEMIYIIEGEATLTMEGKPDTLLKAGDSILVPTGVVHGGKNGDKPSKIITTHVVDKSKPLSTPAP